MPITVSAGFSVFPLGGGAPEDWALTLRVADVPYVQKMQLEYVFPSYTGLEKETIDDGGDIAVLRGAQVHLRITPTMKTTGGQVILNGTQKLPLTLEKDGTLTAAFTADVDGSYRVDLTAPSGEMSAASPQYTVDVLDDRPPSVSFSKPGRDTSASAIEEVFVEASADDDFGVKSLDLVYSVNGGPEKTISLFGGSKRLPQVTAGHTFYLEELDVKPGDSVSYYAKAVDNGAGGGQPFGQSGASPVA